MKFGAFIPCQLAVWRPCCSPIWSTRLRPQPVLEIQPGSNCFINTTKSSGTISPALPERKSIQLVTDSSPPSTVQRGQCAALRQSSMNSLSSGSEYALAFTLVRSRAQMGR